MLLISRILRTGVTDVNFASLMDRPRITWCFMAFNSCGVITAVLTEMAKKLKNGITGNKNGMGLVASINGVIEVNGMV